jgi:hypothetical protein
MRIDVPRRSLRWPVSLPNIVSIVLLIVSAEIGVDGLARNPN